jgi:acetoin utilization deacetylase AcuC-like enzyme
LTALLLAAADELCDGRIVFVTEGGYDMRALRECIENVVALAGGSAHTPRMTAGVPSGRGEATVQQAIRAQASYWPSLSAV